MYTLPLSGPTAQVSDCEDRVVSSIALAKEQYALTTWIQVVHPICVVRGTNLEVITQTRIMIWNAAWR